MLRVLFCIRSWIGCSEQRAARGVNYKRTVRKTNVSFYSKTDGLPSINTEELLLFEPARLKTDVQVCSDIHISSCSCIGRKVLIYLFFTWHYPQKKQCRLWLRSSHLLLNKKISFYLCKSICSWCRSENALEADCAPTERPSSIPGGCLGLADEAGSSSRCLSAPAPAARNLRPSSWRLWGRRPAGAAS